MGGAVWREQRDIPLVAGGDVEQYDAGQIGTEMQRIRDHSTWLSLRDAGDAWTSAGDALEDIARTLRRAGSDLADAWRGEDAVAHQQALQLMEGTARHLADRARDQATFSNDGAGHLERTIRDFPWGEWYKLDRQEDYEHREALRTLNWFYGNTSSRISRSVSAELPLVDEQHDIGIHPPLPERPDVSMPPPFTPPTDGLDPSTTTGPSGDLAGLPDSDELGPTAGTDAGSGFPDNDPLGAEDRSTGGLAGAGGFSPTSGTGPGSGIGPGGLGGVGGGAGGGPSGGGPGGAGLGGVGPAGIGTGGRGPGVVGAPGGGAAGAGGRGATGGTAGGRPGGVGGRPVGGGMAPMMGGGRGGDGEKSSRDTWLTEDDDPWGSGNDAPPSVIES